MQEKKYVNKLKGFEEHPQVVRKIKERIKDALIKEGKNPDNYNMFLDVMDNQISCYSSGHGFAWDDTPEKQGFWVDVLLHKNFDTFYAKYPKEVINVPIYNITSNTVMEVSNNYDFSESKIRVVFCYKEKVKLYISWEAESINDSNTTVVTTNWLYARFVGNVTSPLIKIISSKNLNEELKNLLKKL